ncbi:MAG TPA: methionyl-tRNA formyltransferase [Intrasporangium sp.]|jgi:methionyl-tRNA formyltransferase|uniref:methionyl-tRNA formyltransferase n=1 Tax=Intrasporangium sp. TaxID=1925024 RepID=UPI002F956F68
MGNHRVVLIGAVHEAMDGLRAIDEHPDAELGAIVTLSPEAAAGVSGAIDLATAARDRGIRVLYVDDVNAPASISAIRDLDPALIAVIGWTRLIGAELLAVPRHGCIGFHASLLPRNRGRAPVNWAILRGETCTGNTMMLLDPGVDTGGIVDQRSTPIYLDDTCATVYERVAALGATMLRDNLAALLEGRATSRRQDEQGASLLPKRTPAMGVTDWTRTPTEVHNWIRAQTAPYPGAFTHHEGEQVMLWSSLPPLRHHAAGTPGKVLEVDATGVRVAAGPGSLVVTEMGQAGAHPMPATEFAAVAGLGPGTQFTAPDEETSAWALGHRPRPLGAGL